MPVLCFGPVCIPLNLLLPFLLGIAHRYGWLRWVRREWLTVTYWKQRFSGQRKDSSTAAGKKQPTAAANGVSSSGSQQTAAAGAGPVLKYVCEGEVCQLVPADDCNSQPQQQNEICADSRATKAAAAAPSPSDDAVRQRKGYSIVGIKAGDL